MVLYDIVTDVHPNIRRRKSAEVLVAGDALYVSGEEIVSQTNNASCDGKAFAGIGIDSVDSDKWLGVATAPTEVYANASGAITVGKYIIPDAAGKVQQFATGVDDAVAIGYAVKTAADSKVLMKLMDVPSAHAKVRQAATLIIAASDSLYRERADYVCDGVDDQVEIHEAIGALPSSDGKVVLLEGIFHTAKEIHIIDKDNLILSGSGKGTHIITNAKFESNLSAGVSSGATTITVDSVTGFREGQRVIIVDDSSDISLPAATGGWDEKDILAISGNVISFATGLSQDYTTLDNSKVYTAYDVLKFTNCNNIQIRDLYIDGNKVNQAVGAKGRNSHAGINLIQSSNSSIDKVYISNCPNLAIRLFNANDVMISSCFLSSSLRGICGYGPSRRIAVLGTSATGHSECGLRLCHIHDSVFIGNSLYGNLNTGLTIGTAGSGNNTVIGNFIYDNTYTGLLVQGDNSENCVLTGNVIYNNGIGIELEKASNYIISSNNIFDNHRQGILFSEVCNNISINGNIIRNNNLDDTVKDGIKIDTDVGNGITISNNVIHGVKQPYGVRVLSGNTNIRILENVLTDNKSGGISDAGTSTIIRNNIGYTTKNASSSTGTGAQQTIAHGLAAAPTKVILWNIEDGANAYQSAAANGSVIKITAVINQDYGWEVEVV